MTMEDSKTMRPRVFLPKMPLRHGMEGLSEFGDVVFLLKDQVGNPCNRAERILEQLATGLDNNRYVPGVDLLGIVGPQIELILLTLVAAKRPGRVRLVVFDPMRKRLVERSLSIEKD